METVKRLAGLALLAAGGICFAKANDFMLPARTCVPFTYCIWYLPDPDKESFFKDLAFSPPDLFHLGYHIPFKGGLGPTYGHELYSNEILPPEQIYREKARIDSVLTKMHQAGVTTLIPYVYTMAFFGQPDQRTGFFHFYDHWQDYADYGLGSKPAADPALWTQVTGPQQLGGGPPGIFHFEPCINQPPWAKYLDLVVQQAADVGYDGMFFDVNTLYCYCPHCQELFDIYLLKKYGRDGLRTAFGSNDHRVINLSTIYRDFEKTILAAYKPFLATLWSEEDLTRVLGVADTSQIHLDEDWRLLRCYMQQSQGEFPPLGDRQHVFAKFGGNCAAQVPDRDKFVQTMLRFYFRQFLQSEGLARLLRDRFGSDDIRRRCCSQPRDLLLWVETQRFWCQSMAAQFARLKQVGQSQLGTPQRREEFFTVANLGSMATMDALNKRRVDGIDLVTWAPTVSMQMFEEMLQPGRLESGVIISNIFAFRWAMAAGTRAGTLLYKTTSERAADLSEAEAAAGGGGAFIQGGLYAPESRRRWKKFFSEHAELWDRGTSSAQVGLLYWNDQVFYEYPEHNAISHRLVHILAESQIPFDMVTEQNLGQLSAYKVVIAPMLRSLDDAQVESILRYVREGGKLVVVDPFATQDKWARPRAANPFGKDRLASGAFGAGRILRVGSDEVPSRSSDYWSLMEERGNAFLLAREYLNQAREADIAAGVDFGIRFVRRMEKELQIKLRWCPEQTDPALYMHAFHIEGHQQRPERMVVHLVNYHIPIVVEKGMDDQGEMTWSSVTKSGEPVPSEHVQITVPLPRRCRASRIQAFSPVEPVDPVKYQNLDGRVLLKIKIIKLYQAIAIDLERP